MQENKINHANVQVKPEEPKLAVRISGQNRDLVKPGDEVLVTCESQGGYPVPKVGITVDDVPVGSNNFRSVENSFTFTTHSFRER